jgi:ketosteroid isomerase-like protein
VKKVTYTLILAVLCTLTALPQSSKKSRENKGDSKNVALVIEELSRAMVDRDKAVLENLVMDEMTYGHSNGKIENKTEFIEEVANGAFDFISINPSEQTIYLSGDTAVVRHIFNAKAVYDGTQADIRIGNILVLKRNKGRWKVLARQAYKL